jgi:hypothetical protein
MRHVNDSIMAAVGFLGIFMLFLMAVVFIGFLIAAVW